MLLKYQGINVKYVPGKHLLVADCLSRAYLETKEEDNEELKYVVHLLKKKYVCPRIILPFLKRQQQRTNNCNTLFNI